MRIRTELRTDSIFIDNPQIFFKLLIGYLVQQNKVIQEFFVKYENHPQLTDLKLIKGLLSYNSVDFYCTRARSFPFPIPYSRSLWRMEHGGWRTEDEQDKLNNLKY